MSIIYFAEYSEENIKIGETFIQNDKASKCVLWKNNSLIKSQTDYETIMNNSNLENFFIIENAPYGDKFFNSVAGFINSQTFEPDEIIIRGQLSDVWAIPIIKGSVLVETKCYLILDKAKMPLEEFERETLENFDHIFSMGPSSYIGNYAEKTTEIFKNFESLYFYRIPEYLVPVSKASNPLIVCNSMNFNTLKENDMVKKDKISLIDIEKCPANELCMFLNIVPFVVDETEDKEFEMMIKKTDKQTISIDNFSNINNKEFNLDYDGKNLEDFASTFVEIITNNLCINRKKFEEGKMIAGSEIK
jgi:hypothetical protein